MAGNTPQNAPDRAGATKQGAVASSGLSGRTDRTARNGEAPVIVPSETKPARSAPMSDAEFDAMYRAIRAELVRAEKPLIDKSWTTKNVRSVSVNGEKMHEHRAVMERMLGRRLPDRPGARAGGDGVD